jgi:hypothetical protein
MSPAALRLMEMLGNKQNLATAFMLREVFDRPMCQRRPRQGGAHASPGEPHP